VGRFAPTPSGDLHLGSLYTAAASYLDARAHGGRWLIRMEDLDEPRVVPGSAAGILRTLERFGFEWDGEVAWQSRRGARYAAALAALRERKLTFECSCSRAQLAEDARYPGTCRTRPPPPGAPAATRLKVEPERIEFDDRIQGRFRQNVAESVGDIVLRRRDGLFAYVLAVVIDDAAQRVTHVVRGADLLDSTPRQMYLQRLLALETPRYAHLPVLTEPGGQKLAKSSRSVPVEGGPAIPQLIQIFGLLNLSPPRGLIGVTAAEAWKWAIDAWNINNLPRRLALPLDS
jgi:glutamyl-Q tRNA(Asp) synthetase